jgi:cell division initiation protein
MDLTAADIHEQQFHDAWRGYNQEEVDDFLDRVAEILDAVQRENAAMGERVQELEQAVATSREAEEMLKTTLVAAQQAAEQAMAKAKAKAEMMVKEAEARAKRATEEARERRASAEADIRRKRQEADRDHQARRKDLDASVEQLRAFESELKQRLKAYLEQQLRALEQLTEGHPPAVRAAVAQRRAPAPPIRVSDQRRAEGARPTDAPRGRPETGEPPRPQDEGEGGPKAEVVLPDEAEATPRRSVRSLFLRDDH